MVRNVLGLRKRRERRWRRDLWGGKARSEVLELIGAKAGTRVAATRWWKLGNLIYSFRDVTPKE